MWPFFLVDHRKQCPRITTIEDPTSKVHLFLWSLNLASHKWVVAIEWEAERRLSANQRLRHDFQILYKSSTWFWNYPNKTDKEPEPKSWLHCHFKINGKGPCWLPINGQTKYSRKIQLAVVLVRKLHTGRGRRGWEGSQALMAMKKGWRRERVVTSPGIQTHTQFQVLDFYIPPNSKPQKMRLFLYKLKNSVENSILDSEVIEPRKRTLSHFPTWSFLLQVYLYLGSSELILHESCRWDPNQPLLPPKEQAQNGTLLGGNTEILLALKKRLCYKGWRRRGKEMRSPN